MKVLVFYSGEFGQRVVGNLANCSGFCISCGEGCTQCRSVFHCMSEDLVYIVEMPDPSTLGAFIDDVEPYLPKAIPQADIAVVINVHPDILFGLLPKLKDAGVKGIIGGSERPQELPLGQGDVKWDEYLSALEQVGYKGFLTIEREVGDDPAKDIAAAVTFLRAKIS